jgi:hypothetical protein
MEGRVEVGEGTLLDIQDPKVWFEDGNIIIAAVNDTKNHRHLFKCHQALVAQRLPALKNTLEAAAIADSISASETLLRLPIVHLHDPYEHLKALLRVLYNPWFVVAHIYSVSIRMLTPIHVFCK